MPRKQQDPNSKGKTNKAVEDFLNKTNEAANPLDILLGKVSQGMDQQVPNGTQQVPSSNQPTTPPQQVNPADDNYRSQRAGLIDRIMHDLRHGVNTAGEPPGYGGFMGGTDLDTAYQEMLYKARKNPLEAARALEEFHQHKTPAELDPGGAFSESNIDLAKTQFGNLENSVKAYRDFLAKNQGRETSVNAPQSARDTALRQQKLEGVNQEVGRLSSEQPVSEKGALERGGILSELEKQGKGLKAQGAVTPPQAGAGQQTQRYGGTPELGPFDQFAELGPDRAKMLERQAVQEADYNVKKERQQDSAKMDYGQTMAELQTALGAEQYAQDEASRMKASEAATSLPPSDPMDKWYKLLTKQEPEKDSGILGIISVLGSAFGGAHPDQIASMIDQLKGGPQNRQKQEANKTLAELQIRRHEAEQSRLFQGELAGNRAQNEAGIAALHEQGTQGRFDTEQENLGSRLERQLQGNVEVAKIRSQKEPKTHSVSDILQSLKYGGSSIDQAIDDNQAALNNLDRQTPPQMMADPSYLGQKRRLLVERQQLEDQKSKFSNSAFEKFSRGEGMPMSPYGPGEPDPVRKETIDMIDKILNQQRKK